VEGAVLALNRTTDLWNPDEPIRYPLNDHYTLAQLRLGQAMFASDWYQSWRRVSFLQHNAALHLLSRSAVTTGACCEAARASFGLAGGDGGDAQPELVECRLLPVERPLLDRR
jgi:hypothetical protein